MHKKFKHILWDWNGTLLDDTHLSLSIVNELLEENSLKTHEHNFLRDLDHFPITNFYKEIGFKEEVLRKNAMTEWSLRYKNRFHSETKLHSNCIEILKALQSQNITQYILSAHHQVGLNHDVEKFKITSCFKEISGVELSSQGISKIDSGKNLITRNAIEPKECLIVGDSTHDAEVAKETGISCVLIGKGIMSKARLLETGFPVFDSLEEVFK